MAAAELPFGPLFLDVPVSDAELMAEEAKRVAHDLEEAESLFRTAAGNRSAVQWRCGTAAPNAFITEHARAADLIVLGRPAHDDAADWRFAVRPGDVVMEIGRPILAAPPGESSLSAKRVIIGWKNTREARRAAWDSLPFFEGVRRAFHRLRG